MKNYLLVVLLTNKCDDYQKKLSEDVALREVQKPKNVTYYKNRSLPFAHLLIVAYWKQVDTASSIFIFLGVNLKI